MAFHFKAASTALRLGIVVSLVSLVLGCAVAESNRLQSELQACLAPLNSDPAYFAARAAIDPEGGITPSMQADDSYPSEDELALFADYLDEKVRCERRLVEQTADSFYGDKEKYRVMRKQYQARWQSYASLLSGGMTYGDFYTEQERISAAKYEQLAAIEQRREYAARQHRNNIEEACSAAGGRWNGWRCEAELGNRDRKISCTTTENMTTCNVP